MCHALDFTLKSSLGAGRNVSSEAIRKLHKGGLIMMSVIRCQV